MPKIEQPIYKVIDGRFELFVTNNQDWLNEMAYDTMTTVKNVTTLCCRSMLDTPFIIAYVAKYNADEGPVYVFLDKKFNRLYSYYDTHRIGE